MMLRFNTGRVEQPPFAGVVGRFGGDARANDIGKHAKMLEIEGFLPQLEG